MGIPPRSLRTMETRVIKNRARIGKPWLLVQGRRVQGDIAAMKEKGPRWKTEIQLGEYATREAALAALAELREIPSDRT